MKHALGMLDKLAAVRGLRSSLPDIAFGEGLTVHEVSVSRRRVGRYLQDLCIG
jgi:hypothetical protein